MNENINKIKKILQFIFSFFFYYNFENKIKKVKNFEKEIKKVKIFENEIKKIKSQAFNLNDNQILNDKYIDIFIKIKKRRNEKYFYDSNNFKIDYIYGKFNQYNQKITINKNQSYSQIIKPNFIKKWDSFIAKIKSKWDIDYHKYNDKFEIKINQDIQFNSPSKASDFIQASSTNGWDEWKILENNENISTLKRKHDISESKFISSNSIEDNGKIFLEKKSIDIHIKLGKNNEYIKGVLDLENYSITIKKDQSFIQFIKSNFLPKWNDLINKVKKINHQKFYYKRFENNKFKIVIFEDMIFKTPSFAGSFILGRSSNGWSEWKDLETNQKIDFYRIK